MFANYPYPSEGQEYPVKPAAEVVDDLYTQYSSLEWIPICEFCKTLSKYNGSEVSC